MQQTDREISLDSQRETRAKKRKYKAPHQLYNVDRFIIHNNPFEFEISAVGISQSLAHSRICLDGGIGSRGGRGLEKSSAGVLGLGAQLVGLDLRVESVLVGGVGHRSFTTVGQLQEVGSFSALGSVKRLRVSV